MRNPRAETIELHIALANLGTAELLAVVDTLAMSQVESFIRANPLPDGADEMEMREIMMCISIQHAVKIVADMRLGRKKPAPNEEAARGIMEAAIAKARGQTH
jgi:hypothetical protein